MHHLLLLRGEEPGFRGRDGETEPEQGHDNQSDGTLYGEEPSPPFEVGGFDLSKAERKDTTERTGEGAEGKNVGRSSTTLRLFVNPANVDIDAGDKACLKEANQHPAGVESAVVLDEGYDS